MSSCARIKGDGEGCGARAMEGAEWCYGHDPARAAERKRNARKGGRSGGKGRPQTETAALKKEIRSVIGGVLGGQIPQGRGAVVLQGFNTLLRLHELERRQEVHDSLTPEEMQRQVGMIFEVMQRHVPPERWKALDEELGAILDEASSDG